MTGMLMAIGDPESCLDRLLDGVLTMSIRCPVMGRDDLRAMESAKVRRDVKSVKAITDRYSSMDVIEREISANYPSIGRDQFAEACLQASGAVSLMRCALDAASVILLYQAMDEAVSAIAAVPPSDAETARLLQDVLDGLRSGGAVRGMGCTSVTERSVSLAPFGIPPQAFRSLPDGARESVLRLRSAVMRLPDRIPAVWHGMDGAGPGQDHDDTKGR